MRRSQDFKDTLKNGKRTGNTYVVVHAVPVQKNQADPEQVGLFAQPKVGFIVSKQVGNAVVRKRVTRQLKHLMREILPQLDVVAVVIRANPAAAAASYPQLQRALEKQFSQQGLWKKQSDCG